MTQQVLRSPDGRDEWIATGDDEIAELKARGFTVPSANRRVPRTEDPGYVGNQLARASSTTESSERNSGASVDLTDIDDADLLKEYKRRQAEKAKEREESARRRAESEPESQDDEDDDAEDDEEADESSKDSTKQPDSTEPPTPTETPQQAPRPARASRPRQ